MVEEARKGDWIYTYTGRRFYPIDPRPEDIELRDIAHALAHLCRFTGHTKKHYSVAEHCCHIHDHAPDELRPWALMHDASEAYIGDMSRPLKRGCGDVGRLYSEVEHGIMVAVAEKFGLTPTMPGTIHALDDQMLVTEADQAFPVPAHWTRGRRWASTPRLPVVVGFWDPPTAKASFLRRAEMYFP